MRSAPARLAVLIVAVFVLLAGSAMLRTSTTFDEIIFPAVGARGMATGDFSMVNDHPRLAQYIYAVPLVIGGVKLPPEEGWRWSWFTRYQYAEMLYWAAGNSGDRVAALSRLTALLCGALTVAATFLLARRHMRPGAALLAAALVALTPDMLAHSGIAYNDVPLTLGMLLGVYALDAMARRPGARSAVVAALAFVFAVGVKYSGLLLGPIFVAILALEASSRWRDREWRVALVRAVGILAAVAYVALVLIYPGDWLLREYTSGIAEMAGHSIVKARSAFLLGERHPGGWWYFFPVAFALKTSLGLHVLALLALAAAWMAGRGGAWHAWAAHPARAPAAGAAVLLAVMMSARLNIGTRHALPMLPLVAILIAQGIDWWWQRGARGMRAVVAAAFVVMSVSTLRAYPYFLSYLSEYAAGRPLHRTLVDSNTDWGQGLIALREYMAAHGIDRVALAYFGTAMPAGYGIAYAPLPSYFWLADAPPGPPPRFAAVSATLLAGNYVTGDPYAYLRDETPVAIVGGSLYVFDLEALKKR
jgi:4-amino-4-deoxy-L-arabinose transferase-like glycosyltransferase